MEMEEVMGSAVNSSSPPIIQDNEIIEINNPEIRTDATTSTEVNTEEETNYQRKKRKKTSQAWDEFKEIDLPGRDGHKYECVHCKQQLSAMATGTTSHLLRHMKSCIRRGIAMRGQKKITISTTLSKSESVAAVQNFVYDPAEVRKVFSHMILMHELPFNFAEYDGFNWLMKTACPRWTKISRATLRTDCFTSYELQKKKIQNLLKGANRVSITTDMWTSDQKIQYMVVTGHFVDADLRLQKRTLNFVSVPPPHTGIVIADALHKCLNEWGIDKKIWTITVDNASYNDVAVNSLKDILQFTKKLPLGGKFFHVRCCAHVLNILVQFGLSEISAVINNVRESVKYISLSCARLQIFSDIVATLNLPKKKLILDCGTRWNATYAMLVAALEYKDVFPRYAIRDHTYKYLPSDEEWEKASVVCRFLEEFEVVTNIISGTDYPTSNLFLPELWHIKKVLDDAILEYDGVVMGMANKMKTKFDKYWGQCNLLISVAAVLDPRNKMKFLQYAYKELYSEVDAPSYIDSVRQSLYELFEEYVTAYKDAVEKTSTTRSSMEKNSTVVGGKRSRGRGREGFDNMMRSIDITDAEKSELDIFLEEPVTLHDDEVNGPFDALDWWRQRTDKFCILSRMACDVLSIPITTVASESAFSAGGRVIDPHRASLGTDTVQMLMCTGDWCRDEFGMRRNEKKVGVVEEVTRMEYPI